MSEEEREELDVQETRRLIGPNSYDDNWQLVNYTSELRNNDGNTFPVHQTFTESKIKDSVETTDNPFENESIFLSIDSRKEQRRKGKKERQIFA